jgi:hypothetical protein
MPKQTPKFDRVPSSYKGVKAYKPNEAMQKQIALDMPDELLNMPGMEKWKKLKEESSNGI